MPWINKIMKKLPKKQVTPEELGKQQTGKQFLGKQARKFENQEFSGAPLVQSRKPSYDMPGYRSEASLVVAREMQEDGEEFDENGEYEILEREILPEKIICPDCGGITLEGLDFCDKCGGELN